MTNTKLKQAIWELAEQLSYLPDNQIAEIITDVIEDLLPFAIFEMREDVTLIDPSKLSHSEFRERRTWGKERYKLEEKIEQRREVLKHLRIAKSALKRKDIDHGSLVMIAPQQAQSSLLMMKHSSRNTSFEDVSEEYTSASLMKYGLRYLRGDNLQYEIDHSLLDNMRDPIFATFCSVIEKTSRSFAMAHKNNFIFKLTERKDVELPDWKRTVLFVQFSRMKFEAANNLWSTISNVTREEMNKMIKQLPEEEQSRFRNYMENYNVELNI